jgi:Divergent InlB B-repeat domain
VRRLTILLATVGALLLVPVTQAVAAGTMTVLVEGSGAGEIDSNEGIVPFGGIMKGVPPIECEYASPGPTTGICEDEYEVVPEFEAEGVGLHAFPAAGSEFGGWEIMLNGVQTSGNGCPIEGEPANYECRTASSEGANPEAIATAYFCEEGTSLLPAEAGCGAGPSGPTNLRTLTITKSPSSSTGGGNGAVSSKPKGIKCGATCDEAVASMYKNTPVELTAKPSTGSTFVKWSNPGGACDESTSPTCTVPMSEDEEVGAVFAGTSKAFSPAEALTVSKGNSSGKGTVKGPGLGCEAECTSTVVLFQGPVTEPKPKAGKIVVLKQAPAFGSVFSGWTGCESEPEGNCQVAMETAKEVTAEYELLPNKTLTVNKEYAKGNGSVSSKPKGIKCGTTCTQAVAQMPEGAAVELTAKPSSGTFVKWEGGDCNGSTNPVCVVTMNADETTKAVFSEPGKAFSPQETLTLNKAGSGYGTVKAAGLGCELLCSSTSVLYQGPLTEPKPKPGKVVILKAASAPGSQTVVWSGCDAETEAGECVVEMDENHIVTATFDELE